MIDSLISANACLDLADARGATALHERLAYLLLSPLALWRARLSERLRAHAHARCHELPTDQRLGEGRIVKCWMAEVE